MPRADYACLAKPCKHTEGHECQLEACPNDGSASVYELPTTAKRCPVCGSKRIQRLYNAINISHGVAKAVGQMVEGTYNEQMARHDQARKDERTFGPAFGVPMNQLGAKLQAMGVPGRISLPQGGSRPIAAAPSSEIQQFHGRAPTVAANGASRVDREFKIVRKADGKLEAAKA